MAYMAATTQLENIISRTYKGLGQNTDAVNITVDDVIIPKINSLVDRICKGLYINPLNGQRYTAGDLPFLRKMQFYTIVPKVTATDALAIGDIAINTDTTNLFTSGAILIDSEVIEYAGKDSTDLLGVTGIEIAHDAGANIFQLYDLPNDISNPFTVFRIDNTGLETEIPYLDTRYSGNADYSYTIVQNNSGTRYLSFSGFDSTQDRIVLYYYINSTYMVTLTDICAIPDTWCVDMIPMLCAAEIALENEEADDAATKFQLGCNKLDEMYSYYNSQIKVSRQQFVGQAFDFRSVNLGYGNWRQARRCR